MRTYSVTYQLTQPEVLDPEDEAFGFRPHETIDSGYVAKPMSLRDAIAELGEVCCEHDGAWNWFRGWLVLRNGYVETRSLHLPRNITGSSARRIGRLLGITR